MKLRTSVLSAWSAGDYYFKGIYYAASLGLLSLIGMGFAEEASAYTLRNPTTGVCIGRNSANTDAVGQGCNSPLAQLSNQMQCKTEWNFWWEEETPNWAPQSTGTSTGGAMKVCKGRIPLGGGGCLTAINTTEVNVRPCGAVAHQIWHWEAIGLLYNKTMGTYKCGWNGICPTRAITIRRIGTAWWIGFTGRVPGPGAYQKFLGL